MVADHAVAGDGVAVALEEDVVEPASVDRHLPDADAAVDDARRALGGRCRDRRRRVRRGARVRPRPRAGRRTRRPAGRCPGCASRPSGYPRSRGARSPRPGPADRSTPEAATGRGHRCRRSVGARSAGPSRPRRGPPRAPPTTPPTPRGEAELLEVAQRGFGLGHAHHHFIDAADAGVRGLGGEALGGGKHARDERGASSAQRMKPAARPWGGAFLERVHDLFSMYGLVRRIR